MTQNNESPTQKGPGLLSLLLYKYVPYWPLFALLALSFLLLAFVLTRYITPLYRVTATLVVNDEQRGVEESETLRSLNAYAANTTVENEIQVLTSRTLLQEVVSGLHLYTSVWEAGKVKPAPAYVTSPVVVEVQDPTGLQPRENIPFEFDPARKMVSINGRYYPLDQWINFPYATLRFRMNPRQKRTTVRKLFFSLEPPKATLADIATRLSVSATSKLSSVINIEYSDEVPERGEDIVNRLLDVYSQASISGNNQLASRTLVFINDRIRDVERELDSIERTIQAFRSRNNIVDLSQQGKLYLESVAENDRRAAELTTQLAVLEQVQRYVQAGAERSGIVPTTLGIDDPVLADLLQQLNKRELEYANLRTRIGENNPMVTSVQNEILKIRPNILNIVRNQRARLQASLSNYTSRTGQLNNTLRNIPQQERELLDISRQLAGKNEAYSFLLQRREAAEISAASGTPDSRIVDRAQASLRPESSKRVLFLMAALVIALLAGVTFVFLREGISGAVYFRSDLEELSTAPVAGEIAWQGKRRTPEPQEWSGSAQALPFYKLIAGLGLTNGASSPKRLLVTSAFPGEGKTYVSERLAAALALSGRKVLLIREEEGETWLSSGPALDQNRMGEPVIAGSSLPGLSLASLGADPVSRTSFLSGDGFAAWLQARESEYDVILFDGVATVQSADAFLIAEQMHRTVFLVRHGKTPKAQIRQMSLDLNYRRMNDLALVFNGVRGRGFGKKYFGYGYGFGLERRPGRRRVKQ